MRICFLISLSLFTSFAQAGEHPRFGCECFLKIEDGYNGRTLDLVNGAGMPFGRLGNRDILQINYHGGSSEKVVVRVEEFRGSSGHGEAARVNSRAYCPILIDGQLHELYVNAALIRRVQSVVYLGNLNRSHIPKTYRTDSSWYDLKTAFFKD